MEKDKVKQIINDCELEQDPEFLNYFKLIKTLGKGAFGMVIQALDKRDNQDCAIKSRESNYRFFMVMEHFDGQSLEEYVKKRKSENRPFSNEECRVIIKKILKGLVYIHEMNILHRDLKLENILIKEKENNKFDLRIIDFGLSFKDFFSPLTDNCGTLTYQAPEIAMNKQYQRSVDIWSLGIIQFMIFSMCVHPFWNSKQDTKQSYLEKLKNPNYVFPENMNENARNFFIKTASVNPSNRMTATQALNHVWISQQGKLTDPRTMNDFIDCFQKQIELNQILKTIIFIQFLKKKCSKMQLIETHFEQISVPPIQQPQPQIIYQDIPSIQDDNDNEKYCPINDSDSPRDLFNFFAKGKQKQFKIKKYNSVTKKASFSEIPTIDTKVNKDNKMKITVFEEKNATSTSRKNSLTLSKQPISPIKNQLPIYSQSQQIGLPQTNQLSTQSLQSKQNRHYRSSSFNVNQLQQQQQQQQQQYQQQQQLLQLQQQQQQQNNNTMLNTNINGNASNGSSASGGTISPTNQNQLSPQKTNSLYQSYQQLPNFQQQQQMQSQQAMQSSQQASSPYFRNNSICGSYVSSPNNSFLKNKNDILYETIKEPFSAGLRKSSKQKTNMEKNGQSFNLQLNKCEQEKVQIDKLKLPPIKKKINFPQNNLNQPKNITQIINQCIDDDKMYHTARQLLGETDNSSPNQKLSPNSQTKNKYFQFI